MKMQLLQILTILFIAFTNTTQARTGSISGKILDEKGSPVPYANIFLLNTDSTLAKTELGNEQGEYNITSVANGAYLLKVAVLGYQIYVSDKLTIADNNITQPDIRVMQTGTQLTEVSVHGQKPFIEVHPDKLVVNVENSIVSAGSSAMDVLARSPGVTVDQDDNISLKGKQGVTIMIDGKIVPIAGTDLANMLKGMPSSSIDKIEIISNPSAKYDAAGTAGIINIKTKKDQRLGLNGSINGTYNQGIYPKNTLGFNLNYRDKKFNFYANYNLSDRHGFSRVTFNRHFFTNDTSNGSYAQHNMTLLTFKTNIATLGMDYSISPKTQLGISITGDNTMLGTSGYYFANVYTPANELQSYFATNNNSTGTWNDYAPNIHLQHTFDSSGTELTIDGDYARYWNRNYQDFTTNYYDLDGSLSQAPFLLHGDISGITQIRSFKADYTHPLKDNAHIDAGIKTSFVSSDNEPLFYNRSNGGNILDTGSSDHFIYNENINAAYINAAKDWKKWSTQLGLRAEQTIVSGNEKFTGQTFGKNYLQLFPSFAVQNHIDAQNDLGLTLSRRIERPTYEDLNPYKFFVDPSTYKEGNPYLQPALTYAAELSHTFKQRFITTLAYSITTDVITQVIQPSATQDKVTIQTNENLTRLVYFGLSGAYTIPICKWWNSVNNYDVYYAKYQGDLANTSLNNGKATFDINTVNSFLLPNDWTAELTLFYQAPQVYGYLNLNEQWSLNAGIQKNFFNKTLTVRLNANDIFWKNNSAGTSSYSAYYETFLAKHDTRTAGLSVTYRFGKKTIPPIHKHTGGDEEEKKRMGAAGNA